MKGDHVTEYLRLALAYGGNPSLVSKVKSIDELPPVFCAVGSKRTENIHILHEAGADLDLQEYHKHTALMHAANRNWWDVVCVLLEVGGVSLLTGARR